MKRELKNLEDYWTGNKLTNSKGKFEKIKNSSIDIDKPVKRRGRPRIIKNTNPLVNTQAKISMKENTTIFKSPISLSNRINFNSSLGKHNVKSQFKIYSIENQDYYSFTEILLFLKLYFNLDYENFILKDEHKQEFKAKANDFLKDYTKVYKQNQILIQEDYIESFFELISHFTNLNLEKVLEKFDELASKMKTEILEKTTDYIEPVAFLSETIIKNEDVFKKKGGQYIKYKTIPKWHHYAWDMIKLIYIYLFNFLILVKFQIQGKVLFFQNS